jgi:hypothetical protein
MKWLSSATTASILDLNFKQAFATVSQSREPINALIFWIRTRPAVVPGDELLRAGRQPGWSISGCCASCALFLFSLKYHQILQKRKICRTSFNNVLNSALFDVFIVHNLSYCTPAARSLETMTGFIASC